VFSKSSLKEQHKVPQGNGFDHSRHESPWSGQSHFQYLRFEIQDLQSYKPQKLALLMSVPNLFQLKASCSAISILLTMPGLYWAWANHGFFSVKLSLGEVIVLKIFLLIFFYPNFQKFENQNKMLWDQPIKKIGGRALNAYNLMFKFKFGI